MTDTKRTIRLVLKIQLDCNFLKNSFRKVRPPKRLANQGFFFYIPPSEINQLLGAPVSTFLPA